ncbi:MAG TPA: Gfo/Idh/MocA family oxidoreductase [Burkholderiaceae bacterium]|nr:Gfo/Idh/MocA family oxidoreductase [Burkholderiaceae bacterium]
MVNGKLGWAVVGCGWVARDYVIPAIRSSRNGQLIAVCDCDANALALLNGDDGLRTQHLDRALEAAGVDAVYVTTPNHAHRPIAQAAAAAGKHVLCEKPMAASMDDARAMVESCQSNGITYATAFDQRFHAAHRTLARLVREGALGLITQARIHYACWLPPDWATDNWRADPKRAGGGAMIDLAPHGIDLLEMLLADEWTELHALTQQRVHRYAVDDGAVIMGRFSSGTLATLHVGYNCAERYPRRTLELIGTEARALAVDTMGQTPGGSLTLTDAYTGAQTMVELDDDRSPFLVQVEAFADAVLARRPFAFPPEADLRKFALLEAACR